MTETSKDAPVKREFVLLHVQGQHTEVLRTVEINIETADLDFYRKEIVQPWHDYYVKGFNPKWQYVRDL
jgi:hypothetical protein